MLTDEKKKAQFKDAAAGALGRVYGTRLKAEMEFLCEQHPSMEEIFVQIHEIVTKDADEALDKFSDKNEPDPED